MTRTLVIVGAGGHGKVVADIALQSKKYKEIVFLDDSVDNGVVLRAGNVVGKFADWKCWHNDNTEFFVAIGPNIIRQRMMNELLAGKAKLATLIHQSAIVANCVTIGEGSLVVAGTVINAETKIGKGCIINTSSHVDHDCVIHDYVHIAPGSSLAGTINVGELSFIGIGSSVTPGINIGCNVTVGAGAIVISNVENDLTVVGCPAKILR